MKLLQSIKKKISNRIQYLIRQRNHRKKVDALIKKYKLKDPVEQQKILNQFYLIQQKKRAFGRKTRLHIEEKVRFMVYHKLIEIK